MAFVNAILPSIYELSHSYNSVARNMEDQFKTDLDIIFIYPNGTNNVSVWIKNIGSSEIPLEQIKYCDIFLSNSENFCNPDFEAEAKPSWRYKLVNGEDDIWSHGETVELTIEPDFIMNGKCQLSFFLYNGVSVSDTFST
ncbi:MAG: hypothetical protein PHD41_06980 [Methanosarcinaceae archaeon]|nr:hypothetical protein [Methanosarcinaceae archaeon]